MLPIQVFDGFQLGLLLDEGEDIVEDHCLLFSFEFLFEKSHFLIYFVQGFLSYFSILAKGVTAEEIALLDKVKLGFRGNGWSLLKLLERALQLDHLLLERLLLGMLLRSGLFLRHLELLILLPSLFILIPHLITFIVVLLLGLLLQFHILFVIVDALIEGRLDQDTFQLQGEARVTAQAGEFEVVDLFVFCYVWNEDVGFFGLFWGFGLLALCGFGLLRLRFRLVEALE